MASHDVLVWILALIATMEVVIWLAHRRARRQPMNTHAGMIRYQPDPDVLGRVLSECAEWAREDNRVVTPTEGQLRTIVAATFWASLRRDEDRPVLARVALFAPRGGGDYEFARQIQFGTAEVARLGLTLAAFHAIGVSANGDSEELAIWGTGLPTFGSLVVEAIMPGVLVLSAGHPVAVLRHERADVVDRRTIDRARDLLNGVAVPGELGDRRARNVVLRLARTISRQHHGGLILVVPAGSSAWAKNAEPNPRDARKPDPRLARALARSYETREKLEAIDTRKPVGPLDAIFLSSQEPAEAREWVQRTIDDIAMLATIDGAVVIDTNLNVLSFGTKIAVQSSLDRVRVVQPLAGSHVIDIPLDQIGGMRHQSAAKFVHATQGSSAIVISQDGPISVLGQEEGQVTQLKGVELLRV